MRTGKHVARSYSPPVLQFDYRGLRQISKRLGWSIKRVLRTKQRDPSFPLSIAFVGRQWCYALYEERLQQWFIARETATHEHVLGLKGLSGGRKPSSPREGKPEPVSHEPPLAAQPLEVPEAPAPVVVPCTCGTPVICLAHRPPYAPAKP
jgi:hypothetical protein